MADSRFYVREWPEVPPAKCMVCGANHRRDGRKYIDFGLNIPRYGAVYVCTLCVGEAATLVGYLGPDRARQLETDWEEKDRQVHELSDENDRFRRALSELDFLGSIRSDDVSSVDDTTAEPEVGEGSDYESINLTKRREESKPGPHESNDVRGPSDVPIVKGDIDELIDTL